MGRTRSDHRFRSRARAWRVGGLPVPWLPALFGAFVVAPLGGEGLGGQEPPGAPAVALTGEVVDAETGYAVAGAVVILGEAGQRLTGATGGFSFQRIPAGTYTLTVRMLGYRSWERTLTLDGDQELRIELVRQAIALDTLLVEVRNVTLRGRVRDETTGDPLHRALILVPPDHEARADVAGGFRIQGIRTASPVTVEVRAFGYLPAIAVVPPDIDERLEFELEEDPIARSMIARQMERLDERAGSHPAWVRVVDREDALLRARWTAWTLVRARLGHRRGIGCLFVDEQEVLRDPWESGWFQEYLEGILATDVERIEIHSLNRVIMVRVYTRDFTRRMVAGDVRLRPVQMISTPHGMICS